MVGNSAIRPERVGMYFGGITDRIYGFIEAPRFERKWAHGDK